MKLLKLILILLPFCLFYACKQTTGKGVENTPLSQQSVEISYQLRSESLCSKELIAIVNGTKEIIISANENLNLNIQLQDDFNNDGALDILLENRKGCYEEGDGGWLKHEGSSYFIITYDGKKFIRTKEVGKDWDGIIMEMKKDKLHFTIDTAQERTYVFSDYISCEDKEEVFILDGFHLKTVTAKTGEKIPDIKAVTYEGHLEKISWPEEYVNIDYDIDNDGFEDFIRLDFKKSIKGFDNLYFQSSLLRSQFIPITKRSVKRVGILDSETNGVHDLVLDCNEVLKWNGDKYIYNSIDTNENKYRVFAKSGLIIRDEPDGVPIGKFDYGEEITVVKKTKIKKDYYDEKEERRIDGYWYKTTFSDSNNNKKVGYVFSGFLVNTDYCTLFSYWNGINISRSTIVHGVSNICYSTFPIKIINETEIEMIWAHDSDCKVYPGLSEGFGLENVPEVGKPFARFKLESDQLSVTYYYPEWIKQYKKSYNLYYFLDNYELSYDSLTDY